MIGVDYTITPRRSLRMHYCAETVTKITSLVGPENSELYMLFVGSYLALLLDSPIDNAKPLHVIDRFFKRLTTEKPKELIVRYSSLADELLRNLSDTSEMTITGYFLEEFKETPVFREYLYFFKTGDASCLRYLISFLYFGKKMDYVDPDLQHSAFRDWLQIEEDMTSFLTPDDITPLLKVIIKQLLGELDDTVFLPRHGPGYTAEGYHDPNDKTKNMSFDTKAGYAFRANSFGRVGLDRVSFSQYGSEKRQEQIGKLRFVPKNIKTMRSICMEPTGRMFLQQEIMRWLVYSIHNGPLGNIVDLRDQSHNQRYAVAGSATFSCDTIDLSAASDRVHIDLVKAVFPSKVLFYLLGTRTKTVDTGQGVIELKKFAPMGSALCFPVQCILFSAITLLAYLMQYYNVTHVGDLPKDRYYIHHIREFLRKMDSDPWQAQNLLMPRVYGDDIICDYRTTDRVLNLLTRCGLVVNASKSFTGQSLIRESCGVYAYNGVDVSPLLFRVPSGAQRLSANAYTSLVGSINNAGDHNLVHLRSFWIHHLTECATEGGMPLRGYLPFVESHDAFGIYTTCKLPSLHTRYNPELQRDENRVAVLRSKSPGAPNEHTELYAYDQWMRARVRGGSAELNFSASRVRPSATGIRLRWTPA